MKRVLLIVFLLSNLESMCEEDFQKINYFEKIDFEMRLHSFNPPLIYDRIKNKFHPDQQFKPNYLTVITEEISCLLSDDYESWLSCFTTNYRQRVFDKINQTPDDFFLNKQKTSDEVLEKIRYSSIVWCIEYKFRGIEYAQVVNLLGSTPLDSLPANSSQLPLSAKFLKKINGSWKYHSENPKPLEIMNNFKRIKNIRYIVNAGYCYHSIAEAGLVAFDPPELLKVDSVRDRYVGEMLFHYPAADEQAGELHAANVSGIASQEGRSLEPEPSAEVMVEPVMERLRAVPIWVWGLGSYALMMTVLWLRKKR